MPSEVAIGQQLQALFPEVEARGVVEKLRTVLNSGTVTVLSPAFHRYLIPCSPQKPSRRFEKMLQRSTIAPLLEGEQVVGVLVTIEGSNLYLKSLTVASGTIRFSPLILLRLLSPIRVPAIITTT